jgi:hypothetical protein
LAQNASEGLRDCSFTIESGYANGDGRDGRINHWRFCRLVAYVGH